MSFLEGTTVAQEYSPLDLLSLCEVLKLRFHGAISEVNWVGSVGSSILASVVDAED